MRDYWAISDTHLHHENILKFTDSEGNLIRGAKFSCVEEMDEHILDKWNSVVKPGDYVYHLGDVTFGDKDRFKAFWPRFNGSKRLIVGNHDDISFLSRGSFFAKVQLWRMFPDMGLILSHIPLHPSNLSSLKRGDMRNVHGHIHQNPSPEGDYKNVSVEAIDYTPIHLEELRIK